VAIASTMSSKSLWVGAAVARILLSFAALRWLAVRRSRGLISLWFSASLTARCSALYGSIEVRSISVLAGGVTGIPLR
jgi:hypothetical protein